MDALQREYLRERQELSTKLLQAIRSHEVGTDAVNLSLPGLYPNTPLPTAQDMSSMMEANQQITASESASNSAVVTSSNVIISTAGVQYVMPAMTRQYIQVNPDGTQQMLVQVPATVVNTTSNSGTPTTSNTPGTSA